MSGARYSHSARVAVMAGLVSGVIVAAAPTTAFGAGAGNTDACLTGPRGAAPQGERWFYRVERGTKRRCWYTRGETSRKFVQRTRTTKVSEETPDLKTREPLQLSVANARAEADLSSPPTAAPRDTSPTVDTTGKIWTLAERWSDRPDPSKSAPSPTLMVVRPAATQAVPPADIEESLLQRLADVTSIALALAGFITLLIAIFVRRRKHSRNDDSGLPPFIDLGGEPVTTWYEPPMDRLRMARHMSDLPRPAI